MEGTLRQFEKMPPHTRACIVSIETEELTIGEKKVGRIRKVKFTDRLRSNELIGRHLGMFTDNCRSRPRCAWSSCSRRAGGSSPPG